MPATVRHDGDVRAWFDHWRGRLGWLLFALGGAERIIGWGGSIDFLLARMKDPGWVGAILTFLQTHASFIGFVAMLGGVALIVWNERRRTERHVAAQIGGLQPAVWGSDPEPEPAEEPIAAPVRPLLSPNEIVKCRDALMKLELFITGEITPAELWCRNVGSVPRDLLAQDNWIDVASGLGVALQGLDDVMIAENYALKLLTIDLSPLREALAENAREFGKFAARIATIKAAYNPGFDEIVFELRNAPIASNGNFRNEISSVLSLINLKRETLSQV